MEKGNGLNYDIEKTINGLRYSTAKAILIGCRQEGSVTDLANDFHALEEGLYVTPRAKKFFLAGRGGALTKFSRASACGNGQIAGERVVPLSREEAYSWAERYMYSEELDEWFSDMIEDA